MKAARPALLLFLVAGAAFAQLRITTTSLPDGVVGRAYAATLQATGGDRPYRWGALPGALPEGLTLGRGGDITGTPTTAGTRSFQVGVIDDDDDIDTATLSIRIAAALAVSTSSLPNGTVGQPYSASLSASGGLPPYTWSVSGLPAGVTSNSSGVIGGSPTAAGSFSVSARVTDGGGVAVTRSYNITVAQPLVVSTASLPNGTVGVAYSAQLSASGGTTPYRWTVTGLPSGVTATEGGVISGTPTQAGSYSVSARVADNSGANTTRTYAVTIAPAPLTITTASLPGAVVGSSYSAQLNATGGAPPYSWSVTGLPPGITATAGGAISGTPTQSGSYNVSARVTDDTGANTTRTYPVTVAAAPPVIETATLPDGMMGAAYSAQLNAIGGTPPFTWTFTGLPPGLTATASGAISGTPTQAGSFNVTARATDVAGASATRSYAVTIAPAPPSVTTASLPDGTVGSTYSAQLNAAGGTPPYSWTVTGLPSGLTATAGGAISGTPGQAGSYNITARVTDEGGATGSRSYAVTIAAASLIVASSSLPEGAVGTAYSAQLTASGGTPPYTWTVTGLPAPLTATSAGAITGTPSQAGSYEVSARVTDNAGASTTRGFTLSVVAPPLAVTTASLPGATAGAAYSAQLAANGGTPPYTWSVTGLPGGVTATAGGAITGTPAQAGTYDVTARVTDNAGVTASRAYSVVVAAPTLAISNASLPDGTAGTQYSAQLNATGGTPPYSWSVTGLPAGVTATAGGAISGTPTQSGSYNFSVRVNDNAGISATRTYAVRIAAPALVITTSALPAGTVGTPISVQFEASGGTPPYTWSVTGLPPGVSAAGNSISGTPTQAGSWDVVARVTDNAGAAATRTLPVTVTASPLIIATGSVPEGAAGAQYSTQLNASGGTPPYTWSITGLPSGLTATPGGAISGTPAQAGSASVSARVTDNAGASTTRSYTLTIAGPALAVSTATLPEGRVAATYSTQLNATGGSPPYTWDLTGMPPGLSATPAGAIGGTPLLAGSFNVTARVSDRAGASVTRSWRLGIAATPVAISACPAQTAVAGQPYSSRATVAGGAAPYTWALAAGQLPPGIGLDGSTGAVAGVPSQAGNFNFELRVTDGAGSTATRPCSITVSPALTSSVQALPGGVVRIPYAQRLAALGGVPPYVWTLTAGALPPGLSLDAGTGIISGIPQLAGRYTFRARAADQTGSFIEADLSITISSGLSITACAADTGSSGRAYASSFQASGGEPPYTWQLVSGTVPAGLLLDTASGSISGTPQSPGTSVFVVRVTDRPGTSITRECTIRIVPPLAIATPTLATANVGIAYSERLSATGGVLPYGWTTIAGALPPGLFLNSGTGQITGTPTHTGDFRFTIRVTDAAGATRDLEFVISVTATFRIADCPTPVAVLSQPYAYALTAGGGQSPYAWTLSAGALPSGLTLNPATGVITGTPGRLETTDFTLRATDATSSITTRPCSLRVAPSSLLVSTSRQLPDAVIGTPYDAPLAASGGRSPYAWAVIDGRLPAGLQLSPGGLLAGTPMTPGAFMFTVQVSDQDRTIANQVLELRVTPAAVPAVRITGVPEIAAPAQQMFAGVELEQAYPAPITGTLRMRVAPDPGLPEDPAVQFAAGGRAVTFTIPAGETRAVFASGANGIQTGTVAAAVQFDVAMAAAGLDLTPPQGSAALMRVDRLAPRITGARANRTDDGIELVIAAFATTREITSATFRFTPAAGAIFAQTEFTVDLRDPAAGWFGDTRSTEYGSQFTLVQPFRISGAAVTAVAITLTSGQGTSQPVTVQLQ